MSKGDNKNKRLKRVIGVLAGSLLPLLVVADVCPECLAYLSTEIHCAEDGGCYGAYKITRSPSYTLCGEPIDSEWNCDEDGTKTRVTEKRYLGLTGTPCPANCGFAIEPYETDVFDVNQCWTFNECDTSGT